LLTALFHRGNLVGGKKYNGTEAVIYIRNHTTDGAKTFTDEDAIPTKEAVTALFSKLAKKVKDNTAASSSAAVSSSVPVLAAEVASAQHAAADQRLRELVNRSYSYSLSPPVPLSLAPPVAEAVALAAPSPRK
jgi:hypothetical protein